MVSRSFPTVRIFCLIDSIPCYKTLYLLWHRNSQRIMSANNFVERFCHKYFQKNPKKSKDEILKQLTHLYLNGRKLEEIVSIVADSLISK